MSIKKLPQHIINKLKAWEIVERPSSVLKELIENALDAWAKNIKVEIWNWWKQTIKVEDDWEGISSQDASLVLNRYTTSKIQNENDLKKISSYWFRWEALSSIAEVSKFTLQTKKHKEVTANEIKKMWNEVFDKQIPFHKEHWTIASVDELFYNVPAREKFLKSPTTEWRYLRGIFIDFALINYKKFFSLKKDWKTIFNLQPANDVLERIYSLFKKDWANNLKILEKKDEDRHIYWVISDAGLTFSSPENIKIFVNKRPVQDRLLKKAIMDAYHRQIPHNEYPLVMLFLDIKSELVDVNVHPRKLEVKFLDPSSNFNFVKSCIQELFSDNKFVWANFEQNFSKQNFRNFSKNKKNTNQNSTLDLSFKNNFFSSENEIPYLEDNQWKDYKILWQIWHSYIVLESRECLFFVDQHALAERINFEKMKEKTKNQWMSPQILLNPLTFELPQNLDTEEKIEKFNELGFDISLFWEKKIIVYAVPEFFSIYKVDLEKLFDSIFYLENINFDSIIEKIFETKACKNSIKSWEKLSLEEMKKLVEDGFEFIKEWFSCQHGRPSFVKFKKEDIDKFFDRK